VDTQQGPILRQMITNLYTFVNNYIEIGENKIDRAGLEHIPKTTPVDIFNVQVLEEKSDVSLGVKVMTLKDRVKWLINDNVIVYFDQIEDCDIK